MEPMSGGPAYANGQPQQAPGGAGGVCSVCGRELPPPDLEAVAASIDQMLSLEAGRIVPRTAWAGRPPDGLKESLLFWLPSVKSSRQLWERGQALWTEQMTAALSGPCGDCQFSDIPQPPAGALAPMAMQTPEPGPVAPGPTAYLPYEPGPPVNHPPAGQAPGLPSTAWLPAPGEQDDAKTSAIPRFSDHASPAPPASVEEELPTSAFGSSFGGAQPSANSPAPPAPSPPVPAGDEHESRTMILSSMPSVRTATRLVVLEGPVRGRQFSLGRDRTTIGRSIGCHVTVEADAVEYDHAAIVRAGGGWQIELSSTATDLYVNDEPVQGSRTLKSGDVIRIGPARLRFESGS